MWCYSVADIVIIDRMRLQNDDADTVFFIVVDMNGDFDGTSPM